MTTGPAVASTGSMDSRISMLSAANSGPRWSMVGAAMARNTRSGVLVGPGIWRKWRPLGAMAGGTSRERMSIEKIRRAETIYRNVEYRINRCRSGRALAAGVSGLDGACEFGHTLRNGTAISHP